MRFIIAYSMIQSRFILIVGIPGGWRGGTIQVRKTSERSTSGSLRDQLVDH